MRKSQHRGLSAASGESEIEVSVSDTGPGVPAQLLESIFEPFRQVTTHDRRGLGLGLHISRCLIEAHRGRIWAESMLGEGTTFHFTLPRPA